MYLFYFSLIWKFTFLQIANTSSLISEDYDDIQINFGNEMNYANIFLFEIELIMVSP